MGPRAWSFWGDGGVDVGHQLHTDQRPGQGRQEVAGHGRNPSGDVEDVTDDGADLCERSRTDAAAI
jgi:hypothetical protein